MHIAFSDKSVLLEHVTEDVLPQREINSYNIILGMSGVVCLFILVTLLKYCKKFYSKRRNYMNQMSKEEDLFHNECTFQRQDGNQRSSDTISIRTGPVGNPSETEYDEFNKIFHTRYATFSELLTVLRMCNVLYENSFPRACVFASGNRLALVELESCPLP